MIAVPRFEDQSELADWAELSCLFGDYPSVSRSEIAETLEAAGLSDPEAKVEGIWTEIDRRHTLTPESHPVITARTRIERTADANDALAYAFQLLVSTHSFYLETRIPNTKWNPVAKLFETLTTAAMELYLRGRSLNVGAPRPAGIPSRFGECLNYICDQLGELRGQIRSYSSKTKDDDLDVLAWLPFGDRRPGQVIVLLQCASGGNWKSKAPDLFGKINIWQDYISFAVAPLTAFAFPFVCIEELEWRRLSRLGGVLLDRLRIASLCRFTALGDDLRKKLVRWCKTQASRLPKL